MFVITAKLRAAKGKEKELEKLLRSVISQVRQSEEEKDVVICLRAIQFPWRWEWRQRS